MPVCNFFLQGRCRYGEKCWNEHPRGGRGGECAGNQQQNSRGGFGNRVWVNPSQRGGSSFSQSSQNPSPSWSRNRESALRDTRSQDFSFNSQNRFSSLENSSSFDRNTDSSEEETAKHVDTIQKDMEAWETSRQWPFSCYSALNGPISGFVELSPEELRLEYYRSQASGDIQAYISSVQQLLNQWSSRVQELRSINSFSYSNLVSGASKTATASIGLGSSGFSSTTTGFGATASGYSGFGATVSGFGTTASASTNAIFGGFDSQGPTSSFGFTSSNQAQTGFSGTPNPQPSSGFGNPPPSASSFSFTSFEVKPSAESFSFRDNTGNQVLNQSSGFGTSVANITAGESGVFSGRNELNNEELKQFSAKNFTLGQIPLKPPPADLVV